MEQNTDNKLEIKDRLANFYIKNKKKLYVLICIIIIGITSFNILKIKNENENFLIAEKYVKADLILSSGDKKKSLILLDEIILSRNSFYGTLALNLIIEKKLINSYRNSNTNNISSFNFMIDKIFKLSYYGVYDDSILGEGADDEIDPITFKQLTEVFGQTSFDF